MCGCGTLTTPSGDMQSRKAGRPCKPVALTEGRFGTVQLPVASYSIRKSAVCNGGDTPGKAVRDIMWCKSNAPDQKFTVILGLSVKA